MFLYTYIPPYPHVHRQTEYLSPLSSSWPLKGAVNTFTSPSALGAACLCHYTESTATPTVWIQPVLFVLLPGGKDKSLNKMAPFRGMICFQFSLLIGQDARAVLYGSMEAEFDLWRGSIQFIHHHLLPGGLWMLSMDISPLCWDSTVSLPSAAYACFFPDCSQGTSPLSS